MDEKATDSEFLWINQGFVMDEVENLIVTSYVDLRSPENRTAIRTLVEGCRREHALEEAEAILVPPLERIREGSKNVSRTIEITYTIRGVGPAGLEPATNGL